MTLATARISDRRRRETRRDRCKVLPVRLMHWIVSPVLTDDAAALADETFSSTNAVASRCATVEQIDGVACRSASGSPR